MRLLTLILLSALVCRAQVAPTHLMAGQQANSGPPTVAFSVNGGTGHTTNASSLTFSLSGISSGTHLIGIVHVGWGNSPTAISVSGVTWGGVAMTSAGAAATTANSAGTQIFYLANPSTGSPSIVVTLSGTETFDIWADGITYTGVNQTTPVRSGTYATNSTTSGNPLAITVSSQVGDKTNSSTIDELGVQTSSQTQRTNGTTGSRTGFGSDDAAGATTVTHSWNYGSGTHAAVAGFSLAAG